MFTRSFIYLCWSEEPIRRMWLLAIPFVTLPLKYTSFLIAAVTQMSTVEVYIPNWMSCYSYTLISHDGAWLFCKLTLLVFANLFWRTFTGTSGRKTNSILKDLSILSSYWRSPWTNLVFTMIFQARNFNLISNLI